MKITMVFKRAVDSIYSVIKGFSIGTSLTFRRSDKVLDTLKKMKRFRMKYLGYSGVEADLTNLMLIKQCRGMNSGQYAWELKMIELCYFMDEVRKGA